MACSSLTETSETRLAIGFQKCVRDLWGGDDFSDFSVVVEGTTYRCHRFILAAVSGFFQGLFRSNMKECHQNSVEIKGIGKSVLEVIINFVYRGINGLTKDNFLDVWKAAEQLQIQYLIDESKTFSINNISSLNCFKTLSCANAFGSQKVIGKARKYISENFNTLHTDPEMMTLCFDDFYLIIKSDCLKANKEDVVLQTIINWIEYADNFINNNAYNDHDKESEGYPLNEDTQNETTNKESVVDVTNYSSVALSGSVLADDLSLLHITDENSDSVICDNDEKEILQVDAKKSETSLSGAQAMPNSSFVKENTSTRDKDDHVSVGIRSNSLGGLGEKTEESDSPKNYILEVDRRKHTVDLIKACRLFLVSPDFLATVVKTCQILRSCEQVYEKLIDALVQTLDVGRSHDCWPDQAIHRKYSMKTRVMLYRSGKHLAAYNLMSASTSVLSNFEEIPHAVFFRMIVFGSSLFCVHNKEAQNSPTFKDYNKLSRFDRIKKFEGINIQIEYCNEMLLLAHGKHVYFLGRSVNSESVLVRYSDNTDTGFDYILCEKFHADSDCLVRFNEYILVFHTTNNIVCAESFNANIRIKKELESIMDGVSKGMINFCYKGNVYLLQTNGSLWRIIVSGLDNSIDFELVTQLWSSAIAINGSVVYKSKLYLFFNKTSMEGVTFYENLPTSLPQMARIPMEETTEMVPMVIPKSWYPATPLQAT